MKVVCEERAKSSVGEWPRLEIGENNSPSNDCESSDKQLWLLNEFEVGPTYVEKLLYPIIPWSDNSFPSAEKIIDWSENPVSMSCEIEFMLQKPASTPILSGVHKREAEHRETSSSLTRSKFDRVGVCSGVSTVDDVSQLEPSGENDEVIDEPAEKDEGTE
jgi:hypothetical protein